ncbi:DUF2782 domain-containing protein [Chitinimonas sp. BJYL2]|uniref:DUF2782 domain-containing protein n=1 Tax=Chitinimonas sp. BJYL2 TaxID=2976696 RepID=UPI0022B4C2C9|nr:DUF2782 domain-containing protein [Chitinimonas sp. BJYL2]
MRTALIALTLAVALPVLAADKPPAVPPPPPLPPVVSDDPGVEPEITIVERDDATVTEYRANGKLYLIKVKPKSGPEYFLSDDDGTGQMVRRDGQAPVRPPRWVILKF